MAGDIAHRAAAGSHKGTAGADCGGSAASDGRGGGAAGGRGTADGASRGGAAGNVDLLRPVRRPRLLRRG
jgi:hypothetical protein